MYPIPSILSRENTNNYGKNFFVSSVLLTVHMAVCPCTIAPQPGRSFSFLLALWNMQNFSKNKYKKTSNGLFFVTI